MVRSGGLVRKKLASLAVSGLVVACFGVGARAEDAPKPHVSNIAGKIVHFNRSTGMVHLRLEKGNTWIIQMMPNSKYEKNQRNANSSSFKEGDMVAVGVTSSLAENPKKAILMVDWGNSAKYVATTAPAPYLTRMGDFASEGGAGSVNTMGGQRPDTTMAKLGNGGQPEPLKLEGGNGATQTVPNDPRGQGAQGLNSAANPSMNSMSTTRAQWMNPMQNMGVNPYSSGLPSAAGLMGDDEGGGGLAPGGGQMASAGGQMIQIMATVIQANPGSNAIVVRQAGSTTPTNVMVGSNVNVAMLRPGQNVTIIGTATANGIIQATSVIPAGGGR